MDVEQVRVALRERVQEGRLRNVDIAEALGIGADKVSKMLTAKEKPRRIQAAELPKLVALLDRSSALHRGQGLPSEPNIISYVAIDILPTYAGMGGGGTGEGELERAMIPRYLIEDVFRGRSTDFVVVRTRGDSMEPDFHHDDELLCDKRDASPVQPGPFAIFDADDEAYVIKNIEKMPDGRIRIFSTNPKYSPAEVSREETHIIGRPVWFARRL